MGERLELLARIAFIFALAVIFFQLIRWDAANRDKPPEKRATLKNAIISIGRKLTHSLESLKNKTLQRFRSETLAALLNRLRHHEKSAENLKEIVNPNNQPTNSKDNGKIHFNWTSLKLYKDMQTYSPGQYKNTTVYRKGNNENVKNKSERLNPKTFNKDLNTSRTRLDLYLRISSEEPKDLNSFLTPFKTTSSQQNVQPSSRQEFLTVSSPENNFIMTSRRLLVHHSRRVASAPNAPKSMCFTVREVLFLLLGAIFFTIFIGCCVAALFSIVCCSRKRQTMKEFSAEKWWADSSRKRGKLAKFISNESASHHPTQSRSTNSSPV